MSTTTEQPPSTIIAEVEGSGTCYVPDTFASDLQHLCASLDWARVFNTQQQHQLTATELEAAAEAARSIAGQCSKFAAAARES